MTTTPDRRKAAREEIAKALSSRHHAYVLHYVGENFTTPGPRVTAITARNLGTGATQCFEVEAELRRMGVDPFAASSEQLDRSERKMLDAFFAFIRAHKNYYWIHWNMRNSTFGFVALENRQRSLGGNIVKIPEDHRIDLADRLVDIYGDNYADNTNRLRSLAVKNQLALPHLVDGPQQGSTLDQRDFAAVTRSLQNRVDVMYAVATKTHERSLRTQAPLRDRIAASGGILKWAKEHPVISALAIAAPIISFIVGCITLWQITHPQ